MVEDSKYEDLCEINLDAQEGLEENTEPQLSIFDLANDIFNHGTLIEKWVEQKGDMPPQWSNFMILRIMSEHPDCIFFANELNKHWQLPDEMQWRFLKNLIIKKKRYGWTKKTRIEEEKEPIVLLAEYFHCTEKEMRKNIHAIPREKLMHLLETLDPERYKPKKTKGRKKKEK